MPKSKAGGTSQANLGASLDSKIEKDHEVKEGDPAARVQSGPPELNTTHEAIVHGRENMSPLDLRIQNDAQPEVLTQGAAPVDQSFSKNEIIREQEFEGDSQGRKDQSPTPELPVTTQEDGAVNI